MDRVSIGPVKGLRIAVAAFAISIALAVLMLVGGGWLLVERSEEASETHTAICALIGDLEDRTEGARDFLAEHPAGFAGIPAATLRQTIANQERTVLALDAVTC